MEVVNALGRRKSAIARIFVSERLLLIRETSQSTFHQAFFSM